MQASLKLLGKRRFLPIFATQFLGAFNDNLFKTAMVLFATYTIYSDPHMESNFNALATGLFILPFFLLRSEEHTSELQSLMRISYAVFCLKKKTYKLCIHTYIKTALTRYIQAI